MKKPELLAPVGDMDRLKYAIQYGADAVYLGGNMFGMRTAAAKFTNDKLEEAVSYAHAHNVKVYLTVNVLPRNNELEFLPDFLKRADKAGVDAFIVSDIGVFASCKKYAPRVELHVSTQAGIVNHLTANTFYEMGAKRIVPARELSLEEIAEIRENIPKDMDIECFVHGAMCMSFSGRCLLSNYLVGRDSNRGDCAQPCRWKYSVCEETRPGLYFPIAEGDGGTYLFNSKDMCMIEHIPDLIKAGVTSFKIEGRAKSEHYVAVITNAYRHAIDAYFENPTDDFVLPEWLKEEVYRVSYRDYCTGFFYNTPSEDANVAYRGGYNRGWDIVGVVLRCEGGRVYCRQRNRFFEGEEINILQPDSLPLTVKAIDLRDENGEKIETANKAMMYFSFACEHKFEEGAIIRKEREEENRVII